MNAYGGLQIADNTTPTIVGNTAAKHTQGWAAMAASQHGDQAVVASAALSRLTLEPGVYLVGFQLSLEGEDISGTSGDVAGDLTAQLYKGGVAIDGAKAVLHTTTVDIPLSLGLQHIVEVSQASKDAATPTNYVELYLKSGDASGNDVTVKQGQFWAIKLS